MTSEQRYISKELTHFIGKDYKSVPSDELYNRLSKILKDGYLTTNTQADGYQMSIDTTKKLSKGEMIYANMVCFCDIPLEDMQIHIRKYGPFGLSFTKDFIVQQGGYPVFYIAKNVKSKLVMDKNVLEVADNAAVLLIYDYAQKSLKNSNQFKEKTYASSKKTEQIKTEMTMSGFWTGAILGYIKPFDHTLPDDHPDNCYFEREWRVIGSVKFTINDIQRILIPKDCAERFRKDFPEYYGQLSFTSYPEANNPDGRHRG